MRISQIMKHPVETARLDEPAESAWDRMRQKKIHHMVVKDEEKIVGVLSARDVEGDDRVAIRKQLTVRDLMTPFAVKVKETASVRRAANLMRGWTVGCLPVVDGRERLVGIVTVSDLLTLIGRGGEKSPAAGKPERWTLARRAPRHTPHVPI
jgi:CBS domain-containing protein